MAKRLMMELMSRRGYVVERQQSETQAAFRGARTLRDYLAAEPGDDLADSFLRFAIGRLTTSSAQLLQDLLVVFLLDGKRNGYFVEFGAADGVTLSNTYLLETDYGWAGLLVEPNRWWQQRIKANRRARIDFRCVTESSGDWVTFTECPSDQLLAGLRRKASRSEDPRPTYPVPTVCLNDLLDEHGVAARFDYLSIDTEGTEWEILRSFEFSKHRPTIVTVEHNYEAQRENIRDLLVRNGYRAILPDLSAWDDWYVLTNHWATDSG